MHNSARKGVAVGFFDGVHLGHRSILRGAASVMTFRSHPQSIVCPAKAPRLIMPLEVRLATLRSLGLEEVSAIEFTPELAAMEAEDFARNILLPVAKRSVPPGEAPLVRCGANWRFGRGARGDAALLASLGFAVDVVPFASMGGERISSTRIREAIERGALEEAAAMLSSPWAVYGVVAKGKGLGAKLGFPTLNVIPQELALRLPRGVYVARICGALAVANFGLAPTLGAEAWNANILEVHVLDIENCAAPLPGVGAAVQVQLLKRLRDERRFDSLDALRAQIERDCSDARRLR